MKGYALDRVTKWENLFWHQPYKTEGDRLKAIENNMTKDLIFILTKKECKTIKRNFFKNFSVTPSEVVRKGCQIGIETLEKKDTYLIFLSKHIPQNSTGGQKDLSGRSIFDGFIEFEKMNLVFEVKTDSSTDGSQITKYEKALNRRGKYKGCRKFTWGKIYEVMAESLSTNNEIEKLLIGQYMELIEVMGLVEDFYGFKGTTPEEHNHELRNLLLKLKAKIQKVEFDETKKNTESWVPFTLQGKPRGNPHFTITRDNAELGLYVTLMGYSKKIGNNGKINDAITKLCEWNETKKGQETFGRTISAKFYDYRLLNYGRKNKSAPEFQVIVRLDKNSTQKHAKRRFGKDVLSDIPKIFDNNTAKLKEIQIGVNWNILYHKTEAKWRKTDFSYPQVKMAFDALCPLYDAIRKTHRA